MEETRDWLRLSLIPGLGPAGFWSLLDRFGSPKAALAATPDQWRRVTGLSASQVQALDQADSLSTAAERELRRLVQSGDRIVLYCQDEYPDLLRHITHPPPLLYVRGCLDLLKIPSVAVVGSRAATSYGRRTAYRLARELAARGVVVLSGLAQGIDAQAHAGCLDTDGATIAVLGCGLDVVYPRINAPLYRRIASAGLLISEYPSGTRPDAFRFPARNRIIAGLSRGVVVVEAARRSGSLITVQHALEAGREVFAVPGQIDSAKSAGCHWLLQQGAQVVTGVEDILDGLGLGSVNDSVGPGQPAHSTPPNPAAADLLDLIEPYPLSREDLLERSGLSPARFAELLVLLELEGCVEVLPGDRLCRINDAGREPA